MTRLLVLADDFTGALDTGVQFAKSGASLLVTSHREYPFIPSPSQPEVLVMNTDTRHLPSEQVRTIIHSIAVSARKSGIPYFYKKTDSALRGHVGCELAALLEASSPPRLAFFPAYPKMNRVTRNGIQYIDGVPVDQSVFGADPFDPVRHSYIPDIIAAQSAVPIHLVHGSEPFPPSLEPGIHVFDAESDGDLQRRARQLQLKMDEFGAVAGCAGFAEHLPQLLQLEQHRLRPRFPNDGIVVLSGSLNPITLRQLHAAKQDGFDYLTLTSEQKLTQLADKDYRIYLARSVMQCYRRHPRFLVEAAAWDQGNGVSKDSMVVDDSCDLRHRISRHLGEIGAELLKAGFDGTLVITGGDTLQGFMDSVQQSEIVPICEIEAGVVCSEIRHNGAVVPIVTKSGGFGSPHVIRSISRYIRRHCPLHRAV